jgi:hypothetical protein
MVTHPLCAVKPNRINDLTQARQCALLRIASLRPLTGASRGPAAER